MKKFTMGMIAGASALAIGVPLIAQVSSAQSSSSSSAKTRPVPSQACVQAMAGKDDAFLSTVDAMIDAQKTATQAHKAALVLAAGNSDDAQRAAAVKKADSDFHTAMQAEMSSQSASQKSAMDALKTACAGSMGMRDGMMRGPGPMGMPGGFAGRMRGQKMGRGKGPWSRKTHSGATGSVSSQAASI